ncbi:unnamed protein product, partial [Ectocarpus sp. 12 AP-2014]
ARRHKQWPAWIALLSMVLIYVGPLITQAQLNPEAGPAALNSHHSDHHSREHSPAPSSGQTDHSDPLQHLAHGECGYCVLLSKLPVLSSQGTAVPSSAPAVSGTGLPGLLSPPRAIPRFPNAP